VKLLAWHLKIPEHKKVIRNVLRERPVDSKAFRVSHLAGEKMRMQGGISEGLKAENLESQGGGEGVTESDFN